MIELRKWIAVIIFFVGLAGAFTLFSDTFAWSTLLVTVFCFVLFSPTLSGRAKEKAKGLMTVILPICLSC